MKTMKKPKFWQVYVIMTALLFIFPLATAYADEDDEEGEIIDLLIDPTGTPVGRTLNGIPITASYLPNSGLVSVSLSNDLGEVTTRLTNMTNGISNSLVIDSTCSTYLMPITLGSGLYLIEFRAINGTIYFGYFTVH